MRSLVAGHRADIEKHEAVELERLPRRRPPRRIRPEQVRVDAERHHDDLVLANARLEEPGPRPFGRRHQGEMVEPVYAEQRGQRRHPVSRPVAKLGRAEGEDAPRRDVARPELHRRENAVLDVHGATRACDGGKRGGLLRGKQPRFARPVAPQ